jgi:hypothetical protein
MLTPISLSSLVKMLFTRKPSNTVVWVFSSVKSELLLVLPLLVMPSSFQPLNKFTLLLLVSTFQVSVPKKMLLLVSLLLQ